MADKIAKRGVSIFIDGKEVSNSVKGITAEMRKLQNEQAKMTMGADNYVAHGKKIEYLKSLLVEHKDYQKQIAKEYANMEKAVDDFGEKSESGLSKAANGFNKYFALFTAALATITGLTLGLKKFMDMRNELESSKANLKSLTGLGDNDIQWLGNYAKELSTTTTKAGVIITSTSKEIMDGFTTIGSKRPELLKNKEAMALVTEEALNLAATGVPVETAFEVVTASMNQFNLTSKDSKRIINTIAAGSLEGSAEANNLAESLKNVGTVANGSNMTLEQTVAMLEVLASKQLVGEEAGTKLRGALLKMKEAGVGYASGEFNVRDAIEEVNKKLKEKHSALERDALLQKVFGAENITAGQILLENVDTYDRLTKAVTGTNVAMTQAKIQSETVAAKMKQAQNRFNELGMELVADLNPAMLKAANIGNGFMKMLIESPKWIRENKGLLISLAGALSVYAMWVSVITIAERKNRVEKEISLALTKARTIADLAWCAVQQTLAGNFATAGKAMKALNKEMFINPYIAAAAAVAALTYGIYKLATHTTIAEKAWREFGLQSEKEVTTADQLFSALNKTSQGTHERKLLIDKINSVYGEYLDHQLTEKSTLNDIAIAQQQVNGAIREKIGLQLKEKASSDVYAKYNEQQYDSLEEVRNYVTKKLGKNTADVVIDEIASIFKANPVDKAAKMAMDKLEQFMGKAKGSQDQNVGSAYIWLNQYAQSVKNMTSELDQIDKKFKGFEKSSPLTIYTPNDGKNKKKDKPDPAGGTPTPSPDKLAAKKKELNLITEAIDTAHNERLTKLKEAKLKENSTEVEFNNKVMAEDKAYYDLKIAALEKFKNIVSDKGLKSDINKQISELEAKKTELEVAYRDRINKILLDADPVKKENQQYDDRLRELGLFNRDRKTMTADELAALEILEKQHADNIFRINQEANERTKKQTEAEFKAGYAEKKSKYDSEISALEKTAELSKKHGTAFSEFSDIEMDPQVLLYRKRIEAINDEINARKQAGADITELNKNLVQEENGLTDVYVSKVNQRIELFSQFGQGIGEVVGNLAMGNKDAMKSALVGMINIGLDYLKAQAEMAIAGATVQSLAMPDSIMTFGASGVARAGIMVGLIEAAFAAAKTIIGSAISGGYYDGGFTGGNDPREVRGWFPNGEPYHGGEFVTNHITTSNPAVRPVLNLFDAAQRNGTAGSISREDIAGALRLSPSGYYSGGWNKAGLPLSNPHDDGGGSVAGSQEYLIKLAESLERLNNHLDNGIEAPVYISGENGVAKKLNEYNKMITNSKR